MGFTNPAQFIASVCNAVHGAGMGSVILLDRGRPDPTILTFKAKSTPLLQDTQEDKQASLGTDAAPVLQILQVSNITWLRVLSWLYSTSGSVLCFSCGLFTSLKARLQVKYHRLACYLLTSMQQSTAVSLDITLCHYYCSLMLLLLEPCGNRFIL